jgi:SAM-dependent methyltransferase
MFSRPKLLGDDNSADFLTIRNDRIRRNGYLAKIYIEWAEAILNNCASGGVTVEIGATNAITQTVFRQVNLISLDRIFLTTLTVQADAMHMPFASGSVSSLIATDTFHHLPDAEPFLEEVTRVLIDGGRLVLIEPWNNRWAKLVYQRLHPEPFVTDGDWTTIGDGPMTRANGALPWIVFERDYERFVTQFP